MKPISYRQSRQNSAHRGRKAKARRASARGGRARSKPVFGLGRIHLEIGDRIGAMSFGGIGVMRRLTSRSGKGGGHGVRVGAGGVRCGSRGHAVTQEG